jgi:hypothetical protein
MCGAMSEPYTPPGMAGLIEAAILMAKAAHPERWEPKRMLPREAEIWTAIVNRTLTGEDIGAHLQVQVPLEARKNDTSMVDRYCDYRDAQRDLRVALGEGLIRPSYIDESGETRADIDRSIWRTPEGELGISKGTIWIEEETTFVCRYPLVSKIEILERRSLPSPQLNGAEITPVVHPKTKAEVEEAYRLWISRYVGQKPPSRDDDEAHFKGMFPNITRQRIRELRNTLAPEEWRRVGRRKSGQ